MTMTRSPRPRTLVLHASALLALLAGLLVPFTAPPHPALADGTLRFVSLTGSDTISATSNDCTSTSTPCRTIQHAIDVANAGDGIQIEDVGPYTENLEIAQSVAITGAPDTGTIVDGGGMDRVVSVLSGYTVSLSGLTLQDGVSSDSSSGSGGAGIYNDGTLTVSDTTVMSNTDTSSAGGGGIGNDNVLTLINSSVVSNTANLGGGIRAGGTMTITNSSVASNTAQTSGGGIDAEYVDLLTLTDSSVVSNTADGPGGGIYNNYGVVSVTGSSVASNTAQTGGGIDDNALLTMMDSQVMSNTATGGGGGGILADSSSGGGYDLFLTAITLTNNTATGDGGGLDAAISGVSSPHATTSRAQGPSTSPHPRPFFTLYGGLNTVTLADSLVAINTAAGNGGGLYNDQTMTVSGTTVLSNSASGDGGGIDGVNSNGVNNLLTIADSAILSDTAGGDGGGIAASNVLTLRPAMCSVTARPPATEAASLSGARRWRPRPPAARCLC